MSDKNKNQQADEADKELNDKQAKEWKEKFSKKDGKH